MLAGSTCITTPTTTWSGKPSTREVCFDDFAGESSGPIIIGASLAAFIIFILMILLIKKNNNSSGSFNSNSANTRSSLNEQVTDASLTDLLEKLKESYFPKLSIAESFIKGNYLILKDFSGNIISESNIKGKSVILNDLNGNVISEVKFKNINESSNLEFRVKDKFKSTFKNINESSNPEFRVNDKFNSFNSQKTDDSSKLNSTNLKQFGGFDFIPFIRKMQEGEFPEASLLKSEFTSDYVIVKDSSGDVLSKIKIAEINNY